MQKLREVVRRAVAGVERPVLHLPLEQRLRELELAEEPAPHPARAMSAQPPLPATQVVPSNISSSGSPQRNRGSRLFGCDAQQAITVSFFYDRARLYPNPADVCK